MAEIHILNVNKGDCSIIKTNSGNITVFDICGGHIIEKQLDFYRSQGVMGNYQMCSDPTNPLLYLRNKLNVWSIFRFILSHPHMDHMDGLSSLFSNNFNVVNYWDSGVRTETPDFSSGEYKAEDWNKYVDILNGRVPVKIVSPRSGSRNKYYNLDDSGEGGDYISVLSPTNELVSAANESGDVNDASYVILYRSSGGKIVLAGDSRDNTWEHILENHHDLVKDVHVLLAPHHGRKSSRSWDFLDVLNPRLSILGCASSNDLAYDAWNNRGLTKITKNQAGNIVIYPRSDSLGVFIQNAHFAEDFGGNPYSKDNYGHSFLLNIDK